MTSEQIAVLANETDKTNDEIQAELDEIMAEDYLASYPDEQKLELAIGIWRSRQMNAMLDGGRLFHIHVLSANPPTTIKPKEGDAFQLASVCGIGYSHNVDQAGNATDGTTGFMEIALFRDQAALWSKFEAGKTYEVELRGPESDPQDGQLAYYSCSAVGATSPKEIPTPDGINAPAFVKGIFDPITVSDIPNKVSLDHDDQNTWVALEFAVISARRGTSKKTGRTYGFFEGTDPGATVADLKSNPNAKTTISVNDTQVQWTVGSRLVAIGPISPASDDGKYNAQMRARAVFPVLGIPYVQQVTNNSEATSATESAATDDAADVSDF